MRKATAITPANIAFIKYWGRKNEQLRLPANNSISMNLSQVYTITTVDFLKNLKQDTVEMKGEKLDDKARERIVEHLGRVRKLAQIKTYAQVVTQNNFPKSTGIASSASGFAALTLAATTAAGLKLSPKQLSILARQGSGSACRSIPDGFVEWKAGNTSATSYAYSLYPPSWWEIIDIVVIVRETPKKVSSSEGHVLAESSPFYKPRIQGMEAKIRVIKKALKNRNFKKFGEIIEEEAVNMHAVMMTSRPSLFYWLPKTLEIMLKVQEWRDTGLPVYFTLDAGPNVHLICLNKDKKKLILKLKNLNIKGIIVNQPAAGARIIKKHLNG
jgi:diphosphomevalonate decarboxylase